MNPYLHIILFLSALIPGLIVLNFKNIAPEKLKTWLVFAGAYIFSITVIHLIPDTIVQSEIPHIIGLFILLGFFFQITIDLMTSGAEHGHMHTVKGYRSWMLLFGLCIHAMFDGSILVKPEVAHTHHVQHQTVLTLGIVLHKIPAAMVLTAMLMSQSGKKVALVGLVLFSLASPLGLLLSDYLKENEILGREGMNIIFAIVSGNFLHISTVIYYETNPGHHFQKKKFIISALGVMLAILIEFFPG